MNKIIPIIIRHWKSLLFLNLIVIAGTIYKLKTSPKVWSAEAQLIMPNTGSNLNANLGTLGSLNSGNAGFSSIINPLIAQQSILKSNIVMERMWNIDGEKKLFSGVNSYKSLFETEIADKSNTMTLSILSSSPELALKRGEDWIAVYQQRLNELRKQESSARIEFNRDELIQARYNLLDTQYQLAEFEESSGLVNSEVQTQGMISLIDQLTEYKLQAEVRAIANEKRVTSLSYRLGMSPSQALQAVSLSENQDYQKVKNKLQEIEIKLVNLLSTRTEADPEVQDLQEEKGKLQKRFQNYIQQTAGDSQIDLTIANNSGRTALIQQLLIAETEAKAQRKETDQLNIKIAQLKAQLKAVPAKKSSLQKLQKNQDVAEGVYQGLIAKIHQTKIDAFNSYPQVQILEPPKSNPNPVSPDKILIKLNALLASIVGSTALIMLLEKRNPLLQSYDLNFFDFQIIGCIRQLKYFGRSLQKSEPLLNLIFHPNNDIEVDFQRLASTISLKPIENRRLLVTSAIAGEGKSTVTVGLAKALVDLGFRVLMVDADFYKAELTKTLCSDTLIQLIRQSRNSSQEADNPIEIIPNLFLQTTESQRANTAALIKQGGFEQNISLVELKNNYDYIIVDSAPVSLTSETALMAGAISHVLFVVRPNVSERNSVYSSFELLRQHYAQILGLVVNGVETNFRNYKYTARSLEPASTQIEHKN